MKLDLSEVTELARQQVAAEGAVAAAEAALKAAQERLRKLAQEALPEAMQELGLKKITLDSGEVIEVKHDFTCGILVANRPKAYAWLEDHNLDGIIKCEVTVPFGRGELAKAEKLAAQLAKKKLAVEVERSIPWQSLKAVLKERIESGAELPLELFGVNPFNKSIITKP